MKIHELNFYSSIFIIMFFKLLLRVNYIIVFILNFLLKDIIQRYIISLLLSNELISKQISTKSEQYIRVF